MCSDATIEKCRPIGYFCVDSWRQKACNFHFWPASSI